MERNVSSGQAGCGCPQGGMEGGGDAGSDVTRRRCRAGNDNEPLSQRARLVLQRWGWEQLPKSRALPAGDSPGAARGHRVTIVTSEGKSMDQLPGMLGLVPEWEMVPAGMGGKRGVQASVTCREHFWLLVIEI